MRRIFLSAAEHFPSRARFVPQLAHARSLRDWLGLCSIAGRHFLLTLMFFSLLPAFSERIISPVGGVFANRQSLVLSLEEGEEAFYSYTNTNPLNSGFAYDGPVLIDIDGDVELRLVIVSGSVQESYTVRYSVSESNPFAEGSFEKKFIDTVSLENVLLCTGANIINIPRSLEFFLGDGDKPRLSGTGLSVSQDNRLSRYIPCTVTDGQRNWRFIIFLSGGEAGSFSKSEVPFQISDWTTFTFTGKNLIWCIDNGIWSASTDSVEIDRSRTHVVYWQDVAYKKGNPIQSFVLPQKPSLQTEYAEKAVSFTLSGDLRYRFSVLSNGAEGDSHSDSGMYTTLTFDTFEGDYVKARALFAVYCEGVYQGNLLSDYEIDRQPPLPPRFLPSEPGEFARHDLSLKVEAEAGSNIFLSVSEPFAVNSNSYADVSSEFDSVQPGDYFAYKGQPLELRSGIEKAVAYKVFAYAEDKAGNVSSVSRYQVVIDEYNYFLDSAASPEGADGSHAHPYNSFSQALEVINQGKFVHFFVAGTIVLPDGLSVISSNCSFTGLSDARILLQPNSCILLRDASLEMQNCVIQKELGEAKKSDPRFFIIEKSAAIFEDCELSAVFASSGTLLSSEASIVSFKNSGLTVQGPSYACAVSGVNSKISLFKSHAASISDTAVDFSVKGGSFTLSESDCKVIAHLGRIVESSGSNLRLLKNTYTGDFDGTNKNIKPVWLDEKSLVLENKENIEKGF